MTIRSTFAASSLLALALAAPSAAQVRTERVQFDAGASSKVVKGEVKGRDVVDYQFEAAAGQQLFVLMTIAKGGSTSAYFNVTAPGADAAMFIGSTSGLEFHGSAPASGLFTVRVYLMGSAARQSKSTKFSLEIGVTGKTGGAAAAAQSWPAKYDATGNVKCSAGKPALDQQCAFRVVREKGKPKAEIWIAIPGQKGACRFLAYNDKVFTTRGPGDLSWQRKEDNWWVGVDGTEFYFIPDAALLGG